ncbi:MAG TPA: hypothetical protein VF777_00425, partial [Phycisphaerales bacterium]
MPARAYHEPNSPKPNGQAADGVRRFVARDRQHIVDASGRQPQEFEQMLHLTLHGLILQVDLSRRA